MTGAVIGATIAFFVARHLGRHGSQELLGDRWQSIDEWIGDNDLVSIIVLRLLPIVPFNVLNYAAGLTAMRPSRYVVGTTVGMLPGAALTSFAASRAHDPSSSAFLLSTGAVLAAFAMSAVGVDRFRRARSE